MARPGRTHTIGPKAMLQADYGKREKRAEKLRIDLSTAYGLVLGRCTDYLRSRLEGQEKLERTTNERDLLELLKSVKSLSYKYDEDTKYYHVAYHTLLRRFMLFCQGYSINSEYKQRFKEQIEVLEAYNGGVLFRNSPVATACEIKLLGLDVDSADDMEKAQRSVRGK